MRPIRLADRMAPYLAEAPAPSRLLGPPRGRAAPFGLVRRLFGPLLGELVATLDRLVGGAPSVRRRLGGLGSELTVEEFRIEQVVWGTCGLLAGAGVPLALGAMAGTVRPALVLALAAAGLVAGVLARDWSLTRRLRRREERMLAEFPVVADLIALAVVAGEAPADALRRVCALTRGEMAGELGAALARAGAGAPLTVALTELAERTTLEAFARFLQGIVVAVERGTPLAEVVRAQAEDVREVGKRALLEAGARKEVQMLVPVVFLILPVTVLFALFPGLLTLTSLTQ
ncbi:MAG: pilus assembly protein TadB [Jatrophihabitans sp.]|nr:MAG: pilus assembly protein TadB [Jatrophihabitans sp.]